MADQKKIWFMVNFDDVQIIERLFINERNRLNEQAAEASDAGDDSRSLGLAAQVDYLKDLETRITAAWQRACGVRPSRRVDWRK